jgi:hypothetical protein
LLLNGNRNISRSRINDFSYNFFNNEDKTLDRFPNNGEEDTKTIISSINMDENNKANKAKALNDEDSELIFQQMLTILNAYKDSIK